MPWFWSRTRNQRQGSQTQLAPEQTSNGPTVFGAILSNKNQSMPPHRSPIPPSAVPTRQRTSRQTASQPDLHKQYPATAYNARPLPLPPTHPGYGVPAPQPVVAYPYSHPPYDNSRYYPQQPPYYQGLATGPPTSSNRYAFPQQSGPYAPPTQPYHHPRDQPRPHHSSFPPIVPPPPVEDRRGRHTNTWPMNSHARRPSDPLSQIPDRPSRRERSSRSREDVRAGGHSSTRAPPPPSSNPYSSRSNLQAQAQAQAQAQQQQQHPISTQPLPRSQLNHHPVTGTRDVAHTTANSAALASRSQPQYPYGSQSAHRPSQSHENIHSVPHSRNDRHATHPPVTENSTYHAARQSRESLQQSRNRSRPDTPHSWDSSWQNPAGQQANLARRPSTPAVPHVPQQRRPTMIRNDDHPNDQVAETEMNGRPDHPLNGRKLPLYRDGDPKQFSMRSNLSNAPAQYPYVEWELTKPSDTAVSCLTAENRAPYDTRIPIFQPAVTYICVKTVQHGSLRTGFLRWGGIVVWRRGRPLTISDVLEEIRSYFMVPLTSAEREKFTPDMLSLVQDAHRQRLERDRKNGLDVSRERLRRVDTLLLEYRFAGLQFDPAHFWETRELYLRVHHVSWFKGLVPPSARIR